jgi:hypothetical protein
MHIQMSQCGWEIAKKEIIGICSKVVEIFLPFINCGRETVNWLVELISSCEVSECGWKLIDWLVELISSCEVSKCGWKFVNWLVETKSSYEASECGWKVINWLVKSISSCEVSECLSTGPLNSHEVTNLVIPSGMPSNISTCLNTR